MTLQKNCSKIILISPSDVEKEKKVVKNIVEEINDIFKDSNQLLILYTWDTDVSASYDLNGPQGVIEKDLRIEDSDIVVALFYKRFGIPTGDSKSGTEHEIKLALKSYNIKKRPIIKIYFKKPVVDLDNLSESEYQQYLLLREFKKRIQKDFLTRDYSNVTELEKILRKEFGKFLLIKEKGDFKLLEESFKEKEIVKEPIINKEIEEDLKIDEDTEEEVKKGILDYISEGLDSMKEIQNSFERMTKSTNDYTNDIKAMNIDKINNKNPKAIFFIANKFSDKTNKFTKTIEIEQPIIKSSFESFYDSIFSLISSPYMKNKKDKEEIEKFREIIQNFELKIDILLITLNSFQENSKSITGISKEINKSQIRLKKVVNILINNLELGKLACSKIVDLINEK